MCRAVCTSKDWQRCIVEPPYSPHFPDHDQHPKSTSSTLQLRLVWLFRQSANHYPCLSCIHRIHQPRCWIYIDTRTTRARCNCSWQDFVASYYESYEEAGLCCAKVCARQDHFHVCLSIAGCGIKFVRQFASLIIIAFVYWQVAPEEQLEEEALSMEQWSKCCTIQMHR